MVATDAGAGKPRPVRQELLPSETLGRISDDPDLVERYRQAAVNHQVADLLEVRALSAPTPEQAANWRQLADQRRAMGDQLLQQVRADLGGPGLTGP